MMNKRKLTKKELLKRLQPENKQNKHWKKLIDRQLRPLGLLLKLQQHKQHKKQLL